MGSQLQCQETSLHPTTGNDSEFYWKRGYSVINGRINNDLEPSRIVGDFRLKDNDVKNLKWGALTALPEVKKISLKNDCKYLDPCL